MAARNQVAHFRRTRGQMGFGIRIAPGVRVSVTKRGVRAGVGPRVLRVHVGAGRPGISSGAGPVSIWGPAGQSKPRKNGGTARPRPSGQPLGASRRGNVAAGVVLIMVTLAIVAALSNNGNQVHHPQPPLTPSAKAATTPVTKHAGRRHRINPDSLAGVPLAPLDARAISYDPNSGGSTNLTTISCSSDSNCVVGGEYTDCDSCVFQSDFAFLAMEHQGHWSKAFEVPGIEALPGHQYANGQDTISWLDCLRPRFCSAGGAYGTSAELDSGAFVINEVAGTWYRAIAVPGLARLNQGDGASLDAGTCASVGDCRIVGTYLDGNNNSQLYSAAEVKGVWQFAKELDRFQAFDPLGTPSMSALRCLSISSCTATGSDTGSGARFEVVLQKGVWYFHWKRP